MSYFEEQENCIYEAIRDLANEPHGNYSYSGLPAYAPLGLLGDAVRSVIILVGPEAAAHDLWEINWSRKCAKLEMLEPKSVRVSPNKDRAFLLTYEQVCEQRKPLTLS